MQWAWRRIPEGVLDGQRQLGSDVNVLVEAGEFAEVRQRLLRWQRSIGRPGHPVRPKLAAAVHAQQALLNTSEEDPADALEETRQAVANSLIPVTRAYLLSTRFVFKHSWMLDDLLQARWVREFLTDARRFGTEHGMPVETSFQAPTRSIGSFGWTGSARLRCEGTADELQRFVHEVCRLACVGLEPMSLREPFMEEIPTFAQARAATGLVQLSDAQLYPGVPGSKAAEDRDHQAALAESRAASRVSLREAIAELAALAEQLGQGV
jgi:hypothetical protein